MIKVLFLVENLGGGGAEKVLVNLVNNMDKRKFDITVKTLFQGGVNSGRISTDVKYIEGNHRKIKGISKIVSFIPPSTLYKHYVGKEKYDVTIAYMTGIPAKVILGSPFKKIAWLHGDFSCESGNTLTVFGSKDNVAKAYSQFNAVVGVSETINNSFAEFTGINKDLYVVYNTNEVNKIKELSKEPLPKFNKGKLAVSTVGKINKIKGYKRLVTVTKRLFDEGLDFDLYIIGEGPEREEIEKYITDNNIADRVHLVGFKNNPYNYLSQSDVFICSSYSEGLSTATTEALIMGCAIVSTDVSGAKEILGQNNEYGLVVENSDEGLYKGMKELLSDEKAIISYKEKTKERAVFFSTESTVKQAEQLIEKVYNQ